MVLNQFAFFSVLAHNEYSTFRIEFKNSGILKKLLKYVKLSLINYLFNIENNLSSGVVRHCWSSLRNTSVVLKLICVLRTIYNFKLKILNSLMECVHFLNYTNIKTGLFTKNNNQCVLNILECVFTYMISFVIHYNFMSGECPYLITELTKAPRR